MGGLLLSAVLCAPLVYRADQRAELVDPPATIMLLDRQGRFLADLNEDPNGSIGYWRVDDVPDRVARAMIAIEDRRFYLHPGVDGRAILRAIGQNFSGLRRISGASTIAMQVARMQNPGARTYLKKMEESLTALFITQEFGRRRVLAQYLRLAPYGNRIRGIGYAARRYFDKPVEDLSWAEIAFLAAIPQSPSKMNPHHWRGRARAIARGRRILELLAQAQVLTPSEMDLASEQIASISIPARRTRPEEALHAIMRITPEARKAERNGADPIIFSAIDLELQTATALMLDAGVARLAEQSADNGALIVLDRKTSDVLAYHGSTAYFEDASKGAIDYADTSRPSGSTLKPFLYALALDKGAITPATVLDDLFREKGAISNADDRFLGPLLPRVALANSRNVPAARLAHDVGLGDVYQHFETLGLHRASLDFEHYGAGMVVGLMPVTLTRLVGAYTALANEGRQRPLRWLLRQPNTESVQRYTQTSARRVTSFLADPQARLPTFKRLGASEFAFPVALKTGTSQGYRDAWTVAYSDRFIVGVWLGRADAQPMLRVGGTQAAWIAKQVLLHLHPNESDGLADISFPTPEDSIPLRICALSGQRATVACDRTVTEHFHPASAPTDPCSAHRFVTIDRKTGAVADASVPRHRQERRVMVELPSRYADWMSRSGRGGSTRQLPMGDGAIRIAQPEANTRIIRDPDTAAAESTLQLLAIVEGSAQQVVWYVDGHPFRTVSAPFSVRWPIAPGEHVFEARAAYGRARAARVRVFVE